MNIKSSYVLEILKNEGVNYIYHANSVANACIFLKSKSLVSRGNVERLGIKQTPQSSDGIDKRNSIWFDVFTDSVDIHFRASSINVYGPVLFEINADIIKHAYTGNIWITKLNPTKWKGKSRKERWFQDRKELEENFDKGTFDHMIVFRHCGGELPFKNHLRKIILDDPKRKKKMILIYIVWLSVLLILQCHIVD